MEEEKILQEFGLSDKEAKIYLQLLKDGPLNASKIAQLSKINRTTSYLELSLLVQKGLVSYSIRNSKRYYQAAPPNKLIELLDSKKAKIKSILPSLISLPKSVQPFDVEIYEGKEGIKTFYQDVLDNAKEVLAFGVTGIAFEVMEFVFPHFLEKYQKAKITARYLANYGAKKLLKNMPSKGLVIKYLPKEYHSDITTAIYKDKVAIQSLVKENMFVILISDKKLYDGYKSYFEFMWKMV